MIKHHNFFKVHLPSKEYKGDSDDELIEIIMEEFYLFSNGEMTKDYVSINPKEDKFEISIYPSIIYGINKLNYSDQEKFNFINKYLDNSFVDFLTRFEPLYKSTNFIEYHLYFYKGDKFNFIKHIKYEILSIIRTRIEKNKDYDYKSLEIVLTDWINEKMETEKKVETQIYNAENLIVNNSSNIETQKNLTKKSPKDKLAKYSFWITIIALIVSIIIGWKEIISFFN